MLPSMVNALMRSATLLAALSGVALCQDAPRTYGEIVADTCKGLPDGKKVRIELGNGEHITVVCGTQSPGTISSGFAPFYTGQGELSASFAIIGRSPVYPGFEFDGGVSLNPYPTIIGGFNMDFTTLLRLQQEGVVLQEVPKHATLATLMPGARVNLMNHGRVIPFVQFAAGMLHAFTPDDANGFGYAPGVGVIIRATPHCDVKIEAKGDICRGCRMDPVETFGVGYRF